MIAQLEPTVDHIELGVQRGPRLRPFGLALAFLAGTLALWGGSSADTDAVDGFGLISALPTVYWLAVVAATAATALLVFEAADPPPRGHTYTVPMLWLVLLHTAPQLAHDHVRSPAVWAHMGLIRVIEETGSGEVVVDGWFAWPGFFASLVAPLARLDAGPLETLLRFWPSAITGATAVLVAALARRSYPHQATIGMVSSLVYILLAWTGHDAFSPESVGILWYLGILVVVESGYLHTSSAWSSQVPVLSRFSAAGGDRPAGRSTPTFVALLILGYGAIVSHPVVPFFLCMALVILGVYGRRIAWRLLLFIGVSYGSWLLVSGSPWWSDGVAEFLNQVRDLTGNTQQSTGGVNTPSAEQAVVSSVRSTLGIATYGSVLATATFMIAERYRHLRPAVPLVPLAVAPALVLGLHDNGDEIVTVAILFTLPLASILIGRILCLLRHPALGMSVIALVTTLPPVLLVARFGNESFEYATGSDRLAVEAAYTRADDDTLFVADNSFLPWRDRSIGRNAFVERTVEMSEAWISDVEQLAADEGKARIIVVLTRSQTNWRVHGEGGDPDSLAEFARWLLKRPGSEALFAQSGAWVIEL